MPDSENLVCLTYNHKDNSWATEDAKWGVKIVFGRKMTSQEYGDFDGVSAEPCQGRGGCTHSRLAELNGDSS